VDYARARMGGLLDKRLVVVIGKGGVGKSTVAAALGLAAARSGRRAIVAEVAAREDVPPILGAAVDHDAAGAERELLPGLHHLSVDPDRALGEYLHQHLPLGALASMMQHSDAFLLFAAATPGMGELLSIGRVWELTRARTGRRRRYDLVVLDAPATANGLALLAAPRTFAAAARVGPIAHQGSEIRATLCDPARTGVVVVATPEEMPVSEAIGLQRDLRRELGRPADRAIMNAMLPQRFSAGDAAALRGAADDPAVASARWMQARGRVQRAQRARLRRAFGEVPCTSLPFLFGARQGLEQMERLAAIVGSAR